MSRFRSALRTAAGLLEALSTSSSASFQTAAPSTFALLLHPSPLSLGATSAFPGLQWQQSRGYAQPLWKIHRRRKGNPVKGTHQRRLKIVLVKDFESVPGHSNLGPMGTLLSVAPGYARNYLIPKGYARYAIPENLERYKEAIEAAAARKVEGSTGENKHARAVESALRILDKVRVVFRRPVDPTSESKDATTGDQAVGVDQIVENTRRQYQVDLDPRIVDLAEPITRFGEYTVPLRMVVADEGREGGSYTPAVRVSVKAGRRQV